MNIMELKDKYKDEKVLVIDNRHLNTWLETAKGDAQKALEESIKYHSYYTYRYEAEVDFEAKQYIPYVVLKSKQGNYFVTKRLAGDSRLVGGYSLGMGGHVNPCDSKDMNACIIRELEEETTMVVEKTNDEINNSFIDLFIDERSDVSKVHVCALYLIDSVDEETVQIKETEKLAGEWVTPAQLKKLLSKLEGWSEIAYKLLGIDKIVESQKATKVVKKVANTVEETVAEETVEVSKPKKRTTKNTKGE